MSEYAIEAKNLIKKYGSFLAVDHVSIAVKQGEIYGFLGPNGAGKTTTIRMLTGVSTPTEGEAAIMGHNITTQPIEAKSLMGIVPDTSNVYEELTAWDNLIFTAKLYGIPKDTREERADDLLRRFNLHDRRLDKVQGFSRGMKRRICIAMALMNDSRVLFLDEPTLGLDVDSVREIRQTIRRLNGEGLTVFLTTHNLEEANQMCDRIAIINRGRIAAEDTPERLRQTAKNVQSVEISFDAAQADLTRELAGLGAVSDVAKLGDKYRLYTSDPPTVLGEVWDYARSRELKPLSMNTLGPSFEDVFVKLTGREMVAEVVEEGKGRGGGKQ